jgi:23S rRNA (cytosine1962-C5)-methyltransferase
MDLRTGVLHGPPPDPQWIEVNGLRFEINLLSGQKTGFYLDQLPNYAAVAKHAARRSVLDCFCNQGAFALHCARAGAASVTAVDVSADAVDSTTRNAEANGLKIDVLESNVFDDLHQREKAGQNFDLIILDPPSFTKSKGHLSDALRGYKEIHLRALKLLRTEGMLATFCCSHHVGIDTFLSSASR